MRVKVDNKRQCITADGHDISFELLEHFFTAPCPTRWVRVTRREGEMICTQSTTAGVLLEQWIKDGKGL